MDIYINASVGIFVHVLCTKHPHLYNSIEFVVLLTVGEQCGHLKSEPLLVNFVLVKFHIQYKKLFNILDANSFWIVNGLQIHSAETRNAERNLEIKSSREMQQTHIHSASQEINSLIEWFNPFLDRNFPLLLCLVAFQPKLLNPLAE